MQASELDQENNQYTGDVESINFRPSPNFKHMRKYLKAHTSPNQSSDRSTSPLNEEQEQMNRDSETPQASTSSMAQQGQPPLPPNSPPPDLVVPKQEVEDEEYNDKAVKKTEPKVEASTVKNEKTPEKTMCRQFARGTCTRGSSCIYVHELILTQLPGVYTFCKNFQNSICKFPMCKFVHATVFEKEHFYRTGFLPPHTLAHLKESNSALAPPSTPVEPQPTESTEFMNPPPNMLPGVSALPMSGTSPTDSLPLSEILGPSPRPYSLDSSAVRNEFDTDLKPEECEDCPINSWRFLLAKKRYEEQMDILELIREEKCQLEAKDSRLNSVINRLLSKAQIDEYIHKGMHSRIAAFSNTLPNTVRCKREFLPQHQPYGRRRRQRPY